MIVVSAHSPPCPAPLSYKRWIVCTEFVMGSCFVEPLGLCRLNEAQGQLQVIVSVIPECEFAVVGSAQVRTFLRKERVDDVLVLREILATLFPDADGLLAHLERVDELRRWAETSDEWTTFAGLLRDLNSNDYDEASQPIGLTVPLRPYQRQSLQFMLDAEQTDGGLLSVNYRMLPPAPSGAGLSLLYSGSLNHLIADDDRRLDAAGAALSSDVRGGFLCEEMGLGKTIEVRKDKTHIETRKQTTLRVLKAFARSYVKPSRIELITMATTIMRIESDLHSCILCVEVCRYWRSFWQIHAHSINVHLLPPKELLVSKHQASSDNASKV